MDSIEDKLYIRAIHWKAMLTDVIGRNMEEACGLVAGKDQTSNEVFPVTNILHRRVRFRMDPEEQLEIFNRIDENQWELLAIYHSHLQGPSQPSTTDVAEAMYSEVIHLIWSRFKGEWDCRGYRIEKGRVKQVPIYLLEDDRS